MRIRASHILVKHKYEAEDILRLLNSGKSFEDLARQYSSCPSSSEGGDLGFVGLGRLDENFEDAVLALKLGETTKTPIRTRFGYHIIKRTA